LSPVSDETRTYSKVTVLGVAGVLGRENEGEPLYLSLWLEPL